MLLSIHKTEFDSVPGIINSIILLHCVTEIKKVWIDFLTIYPHVVAIKPTLFCNLMTMLMNGCTDGKIGR